MPVLRNIGSLACCPDKGSHNEVGAIAEASLVWEGDTIFWVGPATELPDQYSACRQFDAVGSEAASSRRASNPVGIRSSTNRPRGGSNDSRGAWAIASSARMNLRSVGAVKGLSMRAVSCCAASSRESIASGTLRWACLSDERPWPGRTSFWGLSQMVSGLQKPLKEVRFVPVHVVHQPGREGGLRKLLHERGFTFLFRIFAGPGSALSAAGRNHQTGRCKVGSSHRWMDTCLVVSPGLLKLRHDVHERAGTNDVMTIR